MRSLALAALVACGAPARLAEPPQHVEGYCFRLEAEHYGTVHTAQACADSYELCDFARDRAIAFAGLAHFVAIGSCRLSR